MRRLAERTFIPTLSEEGDLIDLASGIWNLEANAWFPVSAGQVVA